MPAVLFRNSLDVDPIVTAMAVGQLVTTGTVTTVTVGTSLDNPDGFPTTGTTYLSRNYDTEVASQVQGDSSATVTWGSAFGRGSSGGWRTTCIAAVGEDNVGWHTSAGSLGAVDAYRRVFYSFTLKLSTNFKETLRATATKPLKFLDVRQYTAAGTGVDGSNDHTRWVTYLAQFVGDPGKLRLALSAGGAGTGFYTDGVHTNPDISAYIHTEFVWFCIMYDESTTTAAIYLKRQGDSGVTKVLERDETDITGGSEFYQSNGRGFAVGERTICGFWEFADGHYLGDGTEWATIDDLVIADYWTGPVF